MSAPAQTQQLPPGITGIAPFPASRPQACKSPWACNDISPGDTGAWIGVSGAVLAMCTPCANRVAVEGLLASDPSNATAPAAPAPEVGSWEMTGPEELVTPPPEHVLIADTNPWDGPLCGCTRGAHTGTGFARALEGPATGRWVHTGCGLPAIRENQPSAQSATPSGAQPVESSAVVEVAEPVEDDGPAATQHQPDPTDPDLGCPWHENCDGTDHENHDPNRPLGEREDASTGCAPLAECDCKRVSKKTTFHIDAAGRPIHDRCGGLVRDKHRGLMDESNTTAYQGGDLSALTNETSEEQLDDAERAGDAAGAAAGDRAAAGEPAGPADGAAGADEESGGGREEGGGRADGLDQSGGVPAGTGGHDGADHPQPVDGAAVEGQPARGVADRLEAAQGRASGHLGGVREEDRELPPGADEVAAPLGPPQALGGLAAFFAQPSDEDDVEYAAPVATPRSAGFDWSLLADEPEGAADDRRIDPQMAAALDQSVKTAYEQGYRDALAAQPGGPTEMPDSDNYLGEFSIAELLAEVASRLEVGNPVVRLVLRDSTGVEWLVEVPR